MRRRDGRAWGIALLLVGAAALPARSQEVEPVDTTELLREVYDAGNFQRDLPDVDFASASRLAPPKSESGSPFGGRTSRDGAGSTGEGDGDGAAGEGGTSGEGVADPAPLPDVGGGPDGGDFGAANTALQTIGTVLFWGVVALIVIVLLLAIVRHLRDRATDLTVQDDDDHALSASTTQGRGFAPATPRATTRDEAVALAGRGRFLEAAHLLLLDALARCSDGGRRVERATTAREFLGLLPRDGPERPRIDTLVRTVERGLFAERPLDRNHFDAALHAYDELLARDGAAA